MRVAAVLLGVLVLLGLAGCTEEPVPPAPVPSVTSPSPSAAAPPTDHELGMALPGRREVGLGGFARCVAGAEVCSEDPSESWVRAVDGTEFTAGSRWVRVTVSRQGEPSVRRQRLLDARFLCSPARFVLPPDPRGFHPRPETWKGTNRRVPVDLGGFHGVRCAKALHPVGGPWHQEHRVVAVRDDVQLDVQASSEALALRLFEGYVDRLGWTV